MQTPKFQDVYGQGIDGAFDNNKATSWGAVMDGSPKDMAMGSHPYAARDNNLYKDFLRTGTTWTNSVDLSKSSEDITFRAGVTRLDNKGVVPNSGMDRTSINLRSTAKLSKWLSADVKVNYVSQHTNNRVKLAGDPDNIFLNYSPFKYLSTSLSNSETYSRSCFTRNISYSFSAFFIAISCDTFPLPSSTSLLLFLKN